MCFSAPASFIASGGLIAVGGASLATAKKKNRILAAIPFLFGIQQGFEGIQWVYLGSGSVSLLAGYGFLFFAFTVWPLYVPTCVFLLDKSQRKILMWFVLLGTAVSFYFLTMLATQDLVISELKSSISYTFNSPLKHIVNTAYLVAVFGPLLISSHKIFRWSGAAVFVLAIFAWLFFSLTFTSVWCFFAAIVSVMFLWYVKNDKATA
jgi:hypothetical protein